MPKYYSFMVCGYYLYFTSHCIIEAMHVHASDKRLTETGSAKFFVKSNGDTTIEAKGILNDREISKIRRSFFVFSVCTKDLDSQTEREKHGKYKRRFHQ